MTKKKEIKQLVIKHVLLIIPILFIFYMAGVFVYNTFDTTMWERGYKGFISLMVIALIVVDTLVLTVDINDLNFKHNKDEDK